MDPTPGRGFPSGGCFAPCLKNPAVSSVSLMSPVLARGGISAEPPLTAACQPGLSDRRKRDGRFSRRSAPYGLTGRLSGSGWPRPASMRAGANPVYVAPRVGPPHSGGFCRPASRAAYSPLYATGCDGRTTRRIGGSLRSGPAMKRAPTWGNFICVIVPSGASWCCNGGVIAPRLFLIALAGTGRCVGSPLPASGAPHRPTGRPTPQNAGEWIPR